MSSGRGYLEFIDHFYETSSESGNGSIWWVLVPYQDIPYLLVPNKEGDAFKYRPLKPDDMFKPNEDIPLYRYCKIGFREKPLFLRAKARPCIILEPYFEYETEVLDRITGPIKHLKRKPFWAIPIYSLAYSSEDLTRIPQSFKLLSVFLQVPHLFYCPKPSYETIKEQIGLRNLHELEGIARIDRMFIVFEDPKLVKKTKLKLSSDALTLLYYLIADFLNIELSPKEKENMDTIKSLLQEEFEKHSLMKMVLKGLGTK